MNVQTDTGNTLFHLMIFRKILVYLRNEILTDIGRSLQMHN